MVSINIQKKDLWLLSAIMVFLVGVAVVIAYGSGSPTTMGHSANEIESAPLQTTLSCTSTGTSWQECTTPTCPAGYVRSGCSMNDRASNANIVNGAEPSGDSCHCRSWHGGFSSSIDCYIYCIKP